MGGYSLGWGKRGNGDGFSLIPSIPSTAGRGRTAGRRSPLRTVSAPACSRPTDPRARFASESSANLGEPANLGICRVFRGRGAPGRATRRRYRGSIQRGPCEAALPPRCACLPARRLLVACAVLARPGATCRVGRQRLDTGGACHRAAAGARRRDLDDLSTARARHREPRPRARPRRARRPRPPAGERRDGTIESLGSLVLYRLLNPFFCAGSSNF